MKNEFRVRHGQWERMVFDSIPPGPITIVQSSFSSVSVRHYYPPQVAKTTDKKFPLAVRYSDRTYVQQHGTLRRVPSKDRTISPRQRKRIAKAARFKAFCEAVMAQMEPA